MLKLNLPEFAHKIKQKEEILFIYDIIRKKYLVLTPEEWVRQHFIHYLITEKKFSSTLFSVEKELKYNQRQKRTDILVYDPNLKPFVLVECKAPHIKIDEKTLSQALSYVKIIQPKWFILTNGITHFYFRGDQKGYHSTDEFTP